jgi:hypothetical protein
MGLMANIPSVEAAEALSLARGIAIAFGDTRMLGACIYLATGDAALAQQTEIRAHMAKGLRNG